MRYPYTYDPSRPLKIKRYEGIDRPIFYRPGSSDDRYLAEVIDRKSYYKPSVGFSVEAGEHWLDLGANIGAFAIYCEMLGATCDCYEPDRGCFKLLKKNYRGKCINSAVSTSDEQCLEFSSSSSIGNFGRGTVVENIDGLQLKSNGVVINTHVNDLECADYDGAKMDIEGSELAMIDKGELPRVDKLCFEYHFSRDKNVKRLYRRLERLNELYEVVKYPKCLLSGKTRVPDRIIFCLGSKIKKLPYQGGL